MSGMSNLRKVSAKPIGSLLGIDAPECAFPGDLKDDNAVVLVDDALRSQDPYDLRWGPRCLNDPDRLQGPAIIYSSLKG